MSQTIDITPTWGEWGTIFARFVMTGETKAATHLLPDVAQACAAAEALSTLIKSGSLTEEQSKLVREIMSIEMAKAQSHLGAIQYLRDDDEDDEIALQRQEDESQS